jgi:hypothetical protein
MSEVVTVRRAVARLFMLISVAATVFQPIPAFAVLPDCPSPQAYDFIKSHWTPSDNNVTGIRAPLKVRLDGLVCKDTTYPGFAAAWIAIENQDSNGITQIGWIHFYDPSIDSGKWCRFFAIGTGAVQTYGSCAPADDVFLYVKIQNQFDPERHANFYNVYDCGTGGGYTDCVSKTWSQADYVHSLAAIDAETNYGCTVHIMGYSADTQNDGRNSPDDPIQGQDDPGGGWSIKSLDATPATCSNYKATFSDSQMKVHDDRNNS